MKGSSRKTRAGSWMNAAASMSFCRVPFERSLQSVVPPSSRSKSSNQGAIRSSRPSSFRTRPTKYRYSCAVKYDGGDSTSGTIPTSVFTWSGSRTTSTLSTCASPEVGRSWPVRIRSIVVLPAPFGPNKPKNSPGSTAMSTPFNASTVPKRFVSWDAWIAGTPPTTRAALFRTWLMIIERHGPKLFGVRTIVPQHARGPLRLRREHVPERAVRGALQRDGASRLARGECGRPSGCEHQPGRAGAAREIGIELGPKTPRTVTPEMTARATRVVTFGCLDRCPIGARVKSEDWPIPGATGKTREELRAIRDELRRRVGELSARLEASTVSAKSV